MVESEDPSDPAAPSGDKCNVSIAESARKRSFEDGDGVSMRNRREVSAIRDFPAHAALEIDGKLNNKKFSDQMESSEWLDDLNRDTAVMSVCLNQSNFLEPLSNSEPGIDNRCEFMEIPIGLDLDLDRREHMHSQNDTVQLPVETAEENLREKYPPKRVSGHRDFPPGCGIKAPALSEEEYQEAITLAGKKSAGDIPSVEMVGIVNAKNYVGKSGGSNSINVESAFGSDVIQVRSDIRKFLEGEGIKEVSERFQISAAHGSRSSELNASSLSPSKKMKREVGSSAVGVGNSERGITFIGEPVDKNAVVSQSQGEVSIDSEYFSAEMIVHTKIAGNEKNKVESEVDYVQRYGSENKKNDSSPLRNTDNSEGRVTMRKSPRLCKRASHHKKKATVLYGEDFLPHEDGDKKVSVSKELNVSLIPFDPNPSGTTDDCENTTPRKKVRETLRLFQAICRKLLQEKEAKSNQKAGRIDLIAAKLLKDKNKFVNVGKAILGPVPGVEVGDEFHFRVELAIIGLHRPYQSGIDYMKQGGTIIATSVVASGGYADDMDSSDVMIYSGQGGQPAGGKEAKDQKLERGNLALKNSKDFNTPVRVTHGFKEPKGSDSQDVKGHISTFTYDGLYLVEKYWEEKGEYGCSVFKFQMRRVPGQPELAVNEVKKSKNLVLREGLCMKDISQEKEKIPICVVNTIDDERPLPFEYITKMIYPPWYKPTQPSGCDCTNGCSDNNKCVCVIKNGGGIPFNHNGAIVEAKPLVYECGPSCKCPPSCYNRVSQHGIKFRLEVFKTQLRGWGVRSLTSIPSGSFICEYAGELLKDTEAEQRTGNDEYLFDIGNNYNEQSLWNGLSTLIPTDLQSNVFEDVKEGEYTIDAAEYANVGRFINHSCSPNLYAQNVLYDHDDKSLPHIMLFAAENIPPLQELTYHYNYTIGEVRDSSGNVKEKNCYCGSHECTGRLY